MTIEIERASDTAPDPTIVSVAGSCSVPIAPTVRYVKAGTPLRPSPGGWVPSHDGYGELVATDGKWGGESCSAARVAVLGMSRRTFDYPAVSRARIEDIDDNGGVRFAPSDSGPYVVLSDRHILMDMGYAVSHYLMTGMAKKLAELREILEQIKVMQQAAQ